MVFQFSPTPPAALPLALQRSTGGDPGDGGRAGALQLGGAAAGVEGLQPNREGLGGAMCFVFGKTRYVAGLTRVKRFILFSN